MTCVRINLLSGPRNVSTALMYSFAQRSDTRVVDEPLYGYYLAETGAQHPGAAQVIAAMNCDGHRVIKDIILGPCDQSVLFIKNMPHHLINLDQTFLTKTTNIFLIRNPREMLPSLINQIPQPTLWDTALEIQAKLYDTLKKSGQSPPVLDAKELLLKPKSVLQRLCKKIGISFDEEMLHWQAGSRPEDGVWAPYWYHNLHKSTGFQKYKQKSEPFPEFLKSLLAECLPHYEKLYAVAIKADL